MPFGGTGELHNIFGVFYKILELVLSTSLHPYHSLITFCNYVLRSRKHNIPVGLPRASFNEWNSKDLLMHPKTASIRKQIICNLNSWAFKGTLGEADNAMSQTYPRVSFDL